MSSLLKLVLVVGAAIALAYALQKQPSTVAQTAEDLPQPEVGRVDKSVDNAYALCRVFDATGLTAKPCEVSGWGSSVIATVDMTSGEARKICSQISGLMREKNLTWNSGWTLQIRSPFSGDNSIAFCHLPN